jgi:hypothetical protein
MRLIFEEFDGRGSHFVPVVDQDTGQQIGYIDSAGTGYAGFGGMRVSLFDGKYTAQLNRKAECKGFVRGVEAVLNHMVAVGRPAQARSSTAA